MNNNNFYQGYQTYLNYFRQTFGSAPVPSYNEWLQQFSQPNVVNSLSNHDHSWSNVPQPAASSSTSECSDQVTDLESCQVVKKRDRWGKEQTKMLVVLWKENIDDIESARQHAVWLKIKEAIDKLGPSKTVKQLKSKIKNLKDAYKQARDNNKMTGRSPIYSPFYDDFDEILSRRDVVNLPFTAEVGSANSNSSLMLDTESTEEPPEEKSAECDTSGKLLFCNLSLTQYAWKEV